MGWDGCWEKQLWLGLVTEDCFLLFSITISGALRDSSNGSWELLGSDFLKVGHHGFRLQDWESYLRNPGCTLGRPGSSLIPVAGELVSIWMTWASKSDTEVNQGDVAKEK